MVKRREIRNTFALKGDEVEDCLMSSCCACCALVQQEKEVLGRQRAMGFGPQHQAEMGNQGYVPPEGMAVPNGARL
jgi:hypothetical protein